MIRTNFIIKFLRENSDHNRSITYIMKKITIFHIKNHRLQEMSECVASKFHTSVSNILGPESLQLNSNFFDFIALVFLTHKRRTEQPFANNGSYLNRVPSSVQKLLTVSLHSVPLIGSCVTCSCSI